MSVAEQAEAVQNTHRHKSGNLHTISTPMVETNERGVVALCQALLSFSHFYFIPPSLSIAILEESLTLALFQHFASVHLLAQKVYDVHRTHTLPERVDFLTGFT